MASNSKSVPNDNSRSAAQPESKTLGSVSQAVGAIQVDSSNSSPDSNGLTNAGVGKTYFNRIDGELTKTEYEIKNKGLFVVISNTSFNYKHNGHDWSTLNYDVDVKTLKKTFKLAGNPSNLRLGCDLTSEDPEGEGDDQFDVFMNNLVKDNPNEPRYDFLVFVLMSHGLPGEKFLLAEERESPACCGSKKKEVTHKHQGYCHVRDIKKDVVKRIQDSRKFLNIPKIFLVQTCRGNRMAAVDLRKPKGCSQSKPLSPTPTLADEFIPEGSDTYIMFACYENHPCWVDESGSIFVRYFCEVVDELREAMLKHRLIDQRGASSMDTFNNDETMRHPNNYVTESLIEGWMENVAQKTMAKITNALIVMKKTDKNCVLDTEYDKQQPHISSTLRFKLSMLKVLRTQWDDMQ